MVAICIELCLRGSCIEKTFFTPLCFDFFWLKPFAFDLGLDLGCDATS